MEEPAIGSHTASPTERSIFQQIQQWLAMISLLVALLCMGAYAGIIVSSNKQTVASWKISPSVLLAILSSASEYAFNFSLSTSVTVIWWLSVVAGTSLAQLHYIWERGEGPRSFLSAVKAGGNARRVVIAASFISVVNFVANPLLQRATHTDVREVVTQERILLNATQKLPEGWIAIIVNATTGGVRGTRNGLSTAQAWWKDDPITSSDVNGYFCHGTCEGNVPAAGISYNCSSTTQALDLSTGQGTVIFAINTTMTQNLTGTPFLLLTTIHASAVDDACVATLITDTCQIEAGVVEYPVFIQNSTVTLNKDKLKNVTVLSTYVYPGDLPTAAPLSPAGTLLGLSDFLGFYLFANTSVLDKSHYISGSYFGNTVTSMMADMFYQADPSSYDRYTFETCPLKWSSPTEFVLNAMHNFMFRAALRANNSTEIQTFTVQRRDLRLIFHSDFKYLALAMVVMLLGLFVVLFMLQGSWVLERAVSFCPLETAKAFCAPLMERAGQNFTADEILEEIGQTRVGYIDGVMGSSDHSDTRRREGHTHDVKPLVEGSGQVIELAVLSKVPEL